MKKVVFLLIVLVLLCSCSNTNKEEITIKKVSCNEMLDLQKEGAILIDVRTAEEYNSKHLEKAINIDYQEIGDKILSKVKNKDDKIIVYCQSGNRSAKAASTLKEKGYKNIYDLGSINNCGN